MSLNKAVRDIMESGCDEQKGNDYHHQQPGYPSDAEDVPPVLTTTPKVQDLYEQIGSELEAEPLDPDTADLFDELIKGGITAVAASTGNYKTTMMLNLAAYAISTDRKVGIVSLEQSKDRILRRLYSIYTGLPYDANLLLPSDAAMQLINSNVRIVDLSCSTYTGEQITRKLDNYIQAMDVLIVDGAENVARGNSGTRPLVDLIQKLRSLSNMFMSVLYSSQLNRGADNCEISKLDNLAEASEKAQRVDRVIMIGRREETLLTVCANKQREWRTGFVYRLVVRPSLRLDVMSSPYVSRKKGMLCDDQAEFVNVIDGDMPVDMAGDNENCNGLDELIDGSADVIQPTMKPYHSGSGYVPVDRCFFQCDIFVNREKDDVFYMIDLLQMAQFVPAVLNAPGTKLTFQLKPGQVLASVRILARRWQVSEKIVRGFLERANKGGDIEIEILYSSECRVKKGTTSKTPKGTTKGTQKSTRGRAVGCIITLLYYWVSEKHKLKSDKERAH